MLIACSWGQQGDGVETVRFQAAEKRKEKKGGEEKKGRRKKKLRRRAPPSHLRPVDFNTTECRFQFACQSLHDNMAWTADTSTGGEKGTIKQAKGKETEERKEESAAGDKPQTGAITWDFGHLKCVASDLLMDGSSWVLSTPISMLGPGGNFFTMFS